ncbi:hypothetical protein AXG93_3309s1470 [Marchantia polymorpha subsp. ruderalis]|uniref:Uncharacterized protein n=1 Tax=Marchantia polymorpha subsp. ruderalis TaxID=1480154 RepID=A0A176W4J9_MARPO|nr:hypothetical protein AXG93_3309s1470 [Marchantia polymorpha subsp. ruderalis]
MESGGMGMKGEAQPNGGLVVQWWWWWEGALGGILETGEGKGDQERERGERKRSPRRHRQWSGALAPLCLVLISGKRRVGGGVGPTNFRRQGFPSRFWAPTVSAQWASLVCATSTSPDIFLYPVSASALPLLGARARNGLLPDLSASLSFGSDFFLPSFPLFAVWSQWYQQVELVRNGHRRLKGKLQLRASAGK